MRKLTAALACALGALAFTAAAQADVAFGVADDHGKYADDGGAAFFDSMRDVGMTENRITVLWDPDRPTSIVEAGFLARSLPVAQAKGITLVFAIYPTRARELGDPAKLDQFVAFLDLVATSYPHIKEFIVGNEPNQTRFTPSECASGPATYVRMLAAAYDRLKPRGISVVSSLSPRGNDNCAAASNPSWSPVAFIDAMGKAYKALGRSAPIFDVFGFHPYPNEPTDALDKGYQWPNIGFANLDRLKQALWDAFGGTAQPTVEQGLRFKLAELGNQVGILPGLAGAYTGAENVRVTNEETQAQIYAQIVARAVCDSAIASLLFFGLYDEADLGRFQAALMRVDKSKRPSYDAVKAAIAQSAGRCQGSPTTWSHSTTVSGARAVFSDVKDKSLKQRSWGFGVYAEEDATYEASIERVADERGSRPTAVAGARRSGAVSAYFTPRVDFRGLGLAAGFYRYRVGLAAAMNASRTASFTSEVFRVGEGGAKPKAKAKLKAKANPKAKAKAKSKLKAKAKAKPKSKKKKTKAVKRAARR